MARNSRIPSNRVYSGGFAKPLPATGKVRLQWKPRTRLTLAQAHAEGQRNKNNQDHVL